jgi:hypothetical protein
MSNTQMTRPSFIAAALLLAAAGFTAADEKGLNPQVKKIMDEVSEDRIKTIIAKLVSFGTRNTMSSQDDPARGIGAARRWIYSEFKSYSPRLEVRMDKYRVKKQGRIFKDVDLYNVVAVLPGKRHPEAQVYLSAHYDSLNLGARPAGAAAPGPSTDAPSGAASGAAGQRAAAATLTLEQQEKNADLPAPGACDDGSGTAAVMELARVMSRYEFDKTLVFVSFAAEEQGLIGATLDAAKGRKADQVIEAVLNNDIIGTDVAGNGRMSNSSINVYSDESMDSPSQQLSRYVREIGERYLPSMKVDTIFMQDRLGRGGDHTPFQLEGYAAVRLSTPNENYANQHRETDTLENMSVPYTTRVTRLNAAVAATLAMAPKTPVLTREVRNARAAAAPAAGAATRRPTPMIGRGSGYDAALQWRTTGPDDNIKGFTIVLRPTTAPYWQQEIYVGKVTQYTLKDLSVDDVKIGVKAIAVDGSESLVAPYVYPPRQKAEIETVQ